MGYDRLLIFPLRIKPSYAEFSGIIATGGILEHAEGFAFQVAIGIICSLYIAQTRRSWLYSFCALVNLIGLIVSQGRAAIYGVGVAVAFLFLPEVFRRSRPVFLGTLAFFLTFPFVIWPQLSAVPGLSGYLRIERGLSGRDEAWRFALSVIREKPWTGHGFMASAELTESEQKSLRTSGFSGAGTTFHNTYITKAVDLGLIATFIYSLLYLWPLARICRPTAHAAEDALLRSMLILVVTTAIFRDYNIGGIRSTAMAGSIFLGLANLRHLAAQCKDKNLGLAPEGSTAGGAATGRKSPIEVGGTAF
jgi:O-antigen ligase